MSIEARSLVSGGRRRRRGPADEADGEDHGGHLPAAAVAAELLHGVNGAAGGDAGEEEGEPIEGMASRRCERSQSTIA